MEKTKFLTIFASFENYEVVRQTLPAVIAETKENDARLIVHDSSVNERDSKWKWLIELSETENFFLILSTNMSMAHARNMCLQFGKEMYSPDYICFLEDDHGFRFGAIAALISAMENEYGKISPNGLRYGLFSTCLEHTNANLAICENNNHFPVGENAQFNLGGPNSCMRCAPASHWDNVLKGYDTDEYLISNYQTAQLRWRNYHKGFTGLFVGDGSLSFCVDCKGRGETSANGLRLWDKHYCASDERSRHIAKHQSFSSVASSKGNDPSNSGISSNGCRQFPAEKIINKTMEPSDIEYDRPKTIIAELNDLIRYLKNNRLRVSSWYGCFEYSAQESLYETINRGYNYTPLDHSEDDKYFPWFLYWEIVWVVLKAEFKIGQKILDLGGSSSLFSYYLASKGLDVTTVDLQRNLVENANSVARQTGWHLKNHVMDMQDLSFDKKFDHITSICVNEHIPIIARVKINRMIKNLLIPGGRFSITFDYRNPSRRAMINSPKDVYKQFVEPSGLKMRGNQQFFDSGNSYLLHPFFHPSMPWSYRRSQIKIGHFRIWDVIRHKTSNDYTFGALFLEKCLSE